MLPPPASKAAPQTLGIIGVGDLASALVRALSRAHPGLHFHLSPRSATHAHALAAIAPCTLQPSNQAVLDACDWVVIGLRPAQLPTVAQTLQCHDRHHLLILAAGVTHQQCQHWWAPARVSRVMTGLAVQGGNSAIAVYAPGGGRTPNSWGPAPWPRQSPPAGAARGAPVESLPALQALLQPACGQWLVLDDEAAFDASILAVCANAWWLAQIGVLARSMAQDTGMSLQQATALLATNMADVAAMLRIHPEAAPDDLARRIGSPGTFTAQGLDRLQARGAHTLWADTLTQVARAMREASAAVRNQPQGAPVSSGHSASAPPNTH